MILTDSSVVIVYERAPTLRLKSIISTENAVVCGVTIAELFAGVRSAKDEMKLQAALADFQIVPIADALWEEIGRNQSTLQVQTSTPIEIATVAMSRRS